MTVERYEKIFLVLSTGVLLVFLGALVYATLGMGIHLPGHAGEVDPRTVRTTPPFDKPGVRQVGPGRYEVVMLGQTWAYLPTEIRIPAGSEVTFRATSADVVHGLEIEGTRVNAMLIPGHITQLTYRFREPGEHIMLCHEYCGAGHQAMYGKVVVE
jgi:cytochrome c oxidase subunit 2